MRNFVGGGCPKTRTRFGLAKGIYKSLRHIVNRISGKELNNSQLHRKSYGKRDDRVLARLLLWKTRRNKRQGDTSLPASFIEHCDFQERFNAKSRRRLTYCRPFVGLVLRGVRA